MINYAKKQINMHQKYEKMYRKFLDADGEKSMDIYKLLKNFLYDGLCIKSCNIYA